MSSSKQYQTLSLVAAINYLNANRYNQVAISRELGVTPLQVYYYGIGKTKAPKAEICMRFYTKFNILLDLYTDFEDLERHYQIEKRSKNSSKG